MPTYVYECRVCNAVFEADQSIKDDPLNTCVPCGAVGSVKRVIQPVGIAFKGSGFHINDYSSSTQKTESAKEESPKTESSESAKPAEAAKPAEPAKPAESAKPSSDSTTS